KRGSQLSVTTGGNHHELFSIRIQLIGHRRRLTASGQGALPDFNPRLDVESAQIVVHRGRNKDETAACNDGTTKIWRSADERRANRQQSRACPQWNAPLDAPGCRIDGDQGAPWRRVAGQPARGAEHFTAHSIGRPMLRRNLRAEATLFGRSLGRRVAITWDEMHLDGKIVYGRDEKLALRVERPAAPIHAAEIAGNYERAFGAGWREDT